MIFQPCALVHYLQKKFHKWGFLYPQRMHKTPFMIFFLESIIKSLDLKNWFFWSIFYWLGLSEYATDQKNSGGSEISSISTIFGKVCSKFSKNSRTLIITLNNPVYKNQSILFSVRSSSVGGCVQPNCRTCCKKNCHTITPS